MQIRAILLTAAVSFTLATCALAASAISDGEAAQIVNAGREHPVEKVNFRRAEEFPEVVAYGFFAYDRGYELEGVIVGSKSFPQQAAARKALALHHWDTADARTRENLAKAWVQHIALGFDSPIYQATPDFAEANKTYEPLSAVSASNGSVTVRVWIHGKTGKTPARNFYREEYVFSRGGEVSKGESIDRFQRPIQRH